jgi:hypothetical protein
MSSDVARMACGIFWSDSFHAFAFLVSTNTIGSPAKARAFTSSGDILFEAIQATPWLAVIYKHRGIFDSVVFTGRWRLSTTPGAFFLTSGILNT